MRSIVFLVCCWLGWSYNTARAQTSLTGTSATGNLPGEQRIIPPAPATAGLGTYGALPVDLNAGVVNVSVPLGKVNCRTLTVPITLNYRTTGVRVEEVASWVGIGWSLSAGGVITRTVRGLPDESPNGFFNTYQSWQTVDSAFLAQVTPQTIAAKKKKDKDAANGLIDTEPDTYTLSLPGQSVTFVLDSHKQVHLNPFKPWQVQGGPDGTWLVVLPDGVTYEFDQAETTQPNVNTSQDPPFISAWHLSTITSANGQDHIYFDYTNPNGFSQVVPVNHVFRTKLYRLPYDPQNNGPGYPAADPPFSDGNEITATDYVTLILTRISTSTGTVVNFTSDAQRPDLDPKTDAPGRRLTAVDFRDTHYPTISRHFDFTYTTTFGRLRLEAVRQTGQPAFTFQYDESALFPPRTGLGSFAQDHWGFYNGKPNTTLIPAAPPSLTNGHTTSPAAYADRTTNAATMQVGVLKAVGYPTGGHTYFTYEANQVTQPSSQDDSLTTNSATTTGLPYAQLDAPSQAIYDQLGLASYPGDASVKAIVFTLTQGATNVRFANKYTPGDKAQSYQAFYGLAKLANAADYQSGTILYPSPEGDRSTPIALDAGTYVLYAATTTNLADSEVIQVSMSITTPAQYHDRAVGGLRIRRMVDYAPAGDSLVSTYDYTDYDSIAHRRFSTGTLFFDPIYYRLTPSGAVILAAADARTMLAAQEGYHIGYNTVSVTRRGAADGKTVYSYRNDSDSNARNLVEQELTLDGSDHLVKQLTNTYQYEYSDAIPLTKVTLQRYEIAVCPERDQTPCPEYYTIFGEIYETTRATYHCYQECLLKTTSEQLYAPQQPGNPPSLVHESKHAYAYTRLPTGQAFASPSWVRQTLQGGQQLATHTSYAREYVVASQLGQDAATQGLQELAASHVLTAVIETQQWRHTGADSVLTSSSLTHYQHLEPRRSWRLETAVPLSSTSFRQASSTPQQFVQDPRYTETVSYDQLDPWGNVREGHWQAERTAYLWDDEGVHLLAKIQQAHFNQVGYTSFEPVATGRWSYDAGAVTAQSVTGKWGYVWGTTAVALDSLPADTYSLTLWATSAPSVQLNGNALPTPTPVATGAPAPGNGFQCYQYRFAATTQRSTIAISGPAGQVLDEVRLYPSQARMWSYVTESLDGVLAQTDPAGRLLTYEYDELGRLVRTRDEQGRILSQQQYHYAGQ